MRNNFIPLILLGVIIFSSSAIIQDNVDDLKRLLNRITTQKILNAQTIGDIELWNYMKDGLSIHTSSFKHKAETMNVTGLELSNIEWNITRQNGNDELIIKATSTVWGNSNTPIRVIFWWATEKLAFYLEFGFEFSQIPQGLLPNNTATNTNVSSWYQGIKFSGLSTIGISSSTFTDNVDSTYKRGLTITATNVLSTNLPIQKDLGKLIHAPSNASDPITGTFIGYFPLSTQDPLACFVYQINGDIYFTNSGSVKSTSLVLTLTVSTSPSVELTTTILVQVNATEVISFDVVANVGVLEGINFQGTMEGPWLGAFGLPWLTFNDLTLNFNLNPVGGVTSFNFDGHTVLSFQKIAPIYVTFDIAVNQSPLEFDITFETSLLGFEELFDAVIGVAPPNINQVKATGQVSLSISNYDGPSSKGLTIQGNAIIGGTGDLSSTVDTLAAYSKRQLEFTFYLLVPVFSKDPQDIDFKLAEQDPFPLNDNAIINSLQFEFSQAPNAQVNLQTNIAITFDHEIIPRLFDFTAQVTSQQIALNGDMEGEWDHPLGFQWLQLSDITATLVYDTQTKGLTTFDVNANYNITVGLAISPNLVLNFQGDFHRFSATLIVFVPNMNSFFLGMTGKSPTLAREMSFNGQLTISTYAHDEVVAGVTASGNILIMPNGQLAQAIRSLNSHATLNFQFQVGIPVWDDGTPTIDFQYSENGSIHLAPSVILSGFTVVFDISPNPEISVSTAGTVSILGNAGDIDFELSTSISETSGFQLSGDIEGRWNNPFGLSWMTLSDMSATLTFANYKLSHMQFQGTASFSLEQIIRNSSVTIHVAPDFVNWMLQVNDISISSIPEAIQKVFGSIPPEVNDISSLDNRVDITLSTYNGANFAEGLTFHDEVKVSGTLLQKLAVFNKVNNPSMAFQMDLVVPVFLSHPNLAIKLQTQNISINKNAYLQDANFIVQSLPPLISVDANLLTMFSKNPALQFAVKGSIEADSSILLSGDMIGTWNNMFGIHGFDVSNVDVAFGLNPSLCAVDLCISALGLGYNITMGTKQIAMYGYAQVPDLSKIFLDAQVHGANGLALSLREIAIQWNTLVGASSSLHLNPHDFPADWGLTDLDLYIAPEDGTFDQIQYTAGFWMKGGIQFIGVECSVDIKVTSKDFHFKVHISREHFNQMLNNEIRNRLTTEPELLPSLNDPQRAAVDGGIRIVQVTNVSMSDVSCERMSKNHYPRFQMNYDFLERPHSVEIGLDLVDLYEDFSKFFHKHLSGLFFEKRIH